MSNPLVSLTVICYKAEKFILEAIDGALAQTYSPLEIIFSDDHSNDNTFETIKHAIKDYKGPHKIILNRNEKNLGIGAHVSKVWFEIATGKWIIVSAGDDVSLPNRVERIMQVVNENVAALHHSAFPINENSEKLKYTDEFAPNMDIFNQNSVEAIIRNREWLKGATMCLNKNLLLKYGKINEDIVNEDFILAYRAQAFGKIIYLNEPLMLYRLHEKSTTREFHQKSYSNYKAQLVKGLQANIAIAKQILADARNIEMSEQLLSDVKKEKFKNEVQYAAFGKNKVKFIYLLSPFFYYSKLKWILLNPFWFIFRKNKK
jgi:glycosyltransferase involved in cell wall biosynthesis